MGGRSHTQRGRGVRRAALLCALGTLVGALFLCARTGGGEAADRLVAHGVAGAASGPASGALPGPPGVRAAAPVTGPGPGPVPAHRAHASYVCPYDLPACSPFSHVTPGLVPVPPPAVATHGAEPAPVAAVRAAGAARPVQPPARAPDLHVLQVLRT
ncbi:hypothetical protein [Streptomyces sp. NPDC048603]|uniref:hypothetical protein n=1 Tax=Streptomyces sp. NPDC048603 TaxID=3365577 RepID=UPI0037249A63